MAKKEWTAVLLVRDGDGDPLEYAATVHVEAETAYKAGVAALEAAVAEAVEDQFPSDAGEDERDPGWEEERDELERRAREHSRCVAVLEGRVAAASLDVRLP